MKYLNDRYAKIMKYKGMDICVLKKATPSNGDELGYKIDDILYDGMVFDGLGAAMEAIDSLGTDSAKKGADHGKTDII